MQLLVPVRLPQFFCPAASPSAVQSLQPFELDDPHQLTRPPRTADALRGQVAQAPPASVGGLHDLCS